MKYLDLFAGIGGFRLGMESAGHECIGFCEIDKFARASYKAIHNTEGEIELHDITTVTDEEIKNIGHVDVICGGFPCQSFSIAGSDNQQSKIEIVGNTKNPNGTRQGTGSIVYDSNGLIGTLCARDYKEPKQVAIPVLTPDRTNKRQNGRRFKTDGEPMFTLTAQDRHGILIKEATKQGYAEAEIGDSVNLSHPNSKTRRGRVGKQIANTLLTGESQGVVEPDFRIRKLTPRECWRLQGFPDWAFDKAQEVNSNSQLYKQAGNSVTVNVIEVIAREL